MNILSVVKTIQFAWYPPFKMVDASKGGGSFSVFPDHVFRFLGLASFLPIILFLSLLQCGTFAAISFNWFVHHFEILN